MKSWASFLLVVMMLMTPAMREAFSQIAKANIISGTVDLRETDQFIECYGRKDGVMTFITCLWKFGRPIYINYKAIETES